MRIILNNGIARHHWLQVSNVAKEITAKNIRLGIEKELEIVEVTRSVDAVFKGIIALSCTAEVMRHDLDGTRRNENITKNSNDEMLGLWSQAAGIVQYLRQVLAKQRIFSALHFWTMDRRKNLIPREHENTFAWILKEKESNFATWLSCSESVFWISGKPGSGKSTVVKYIGGHQRTFELLQPWIGDDKFVTAAFYFWSSASDELQKSSIGLLRSIMFQILRQCPDLSTIVLASQSRCRPKWDPSMEELLTAYKKLVMELSIRGIKVCLFIDGLDEFNGDPIDAIELVKGMAGANSNVKLCVSSRPWIQFERAFGMQDKWKLYMQDLTREDMVKYATDLLGDRGRQSRSLVDMIVEKAEGVFLWVFLVLRNIGYLDTESTRKKLAKIPNNLDDYLLMLVCDTAPARRATVAKIFRIALSAVQKLPLLQYSLILSENFTMEKDCGIEAKRECAPGSADVAETEKQLEMLSRGLLKLSNTTQRHVEFLHRTVADFLHSESIGNIFFTWSSCDVDQEICRSSLMMLQVSAPTLPQDEAYLVATLHVFLSHVHSITSQVQQQLLGELFSDLQKLQAKLSGAPVMMAVLGPGNYWTFDASMRFTFLYHCMSYGLGEYVAQAVVRDNGSFSEPKGALLSGALGWDPRVRTGLPEVLPCNIQPLLNSGVDCNVPWGDRNMSFWKQLLLNTYTKHLRGVLTENDRRAVRLAMAHNADMAAKIEIFAGGLSQLDAHDVVNLIN